MNTGPAGRRKVASIPAEKNKTITHRLERAAAKRQLKEK